MTFLVKTAFFPSNDNKFPYIPSLHHYRRMCSAIKRTMHSCCHKAIVELPSEKTIHLNAWILGENHLVSQNNHRFSIKGTRFTSFHGAVGKLFNWTKERIFGTPDKCSLPDIPEAKYVKNCFNFINPSMPAFTVSDRK